MVSRLFVLLLFLCSEISWSAAREYWVRPEFISDCDTKQPCLSLSTVVRNTTAYFTSNSIFHFLPGSHTVHETSWVIVRRVHNVSLVGSSLGGRYATIECNGRMSFTFDQVRNLSISYMEFSACGLVMDLQCCLYMHPFLVSCPHVALLVSDTSSVVLEYVRVRNSYGYGLLVWNVVKTTLINCQFYCNNWRSHKEKDYERVSMHHMGCPSSHEHNEPGGNVLILQGAVLDLQILYLNISHSEFAYGVARKANSSKIIIGGGGLGIYTLQNKRTEFYIQICNCSLHNNISPFGANMFLYYGDIDEYITSLYFIQQNNYYTVHINNCKFYNGSSASSGGGLALYFREACPRLNSYLLSLCKVKLDLSLNTALSTVTLLNMVLVFICIQILCMVHSFHQKSGVPKSSFQTHYFLKTLQLLVVVQFTFQLAGIQTSHSF